MAEATQVGSQVHWKQATDPLEQSVCCVLSEAVCLEGATSSVGFALTDRSWGWDLGFRAGSSTHQGSIHFQLDHFSFFATDP